MKRSKVDQAYEYITGINRNYPDWPATFNTCPTEGCVNLARGVCLCADCYEAELAEYAGKELAKEYHAAVKRKADLLLKVLDEVRSKQ